MVTRYKWTFDFSRSASLLLAAGMLGSFAMPVGNAQAASAAQPAAAAPTASMPDWQKAAGGKMEFDVASIRPSAPDTREHANFALSSDASYEQTGGMLNAEFPLSVYIQFAYKVWLSPEQQQVMLASVPKWVSTDKFDIQAKSDVPNPTKDQMRLMMRALLAERFHLVVHTESKPTPSLALTLITPGKLGPKLHPHADGPSCDTPVGKQGADIFPSGCDSLTAHPAPDHAILIGARNYSMAFIGNSLTTVGGLGRPVVDKTGLSGTYDFTLEFAQDSNHSYPSAADTSDTGTTLLEAVREQLGLKLTRETDPVETIVIDHIERPTEN
jgi:uncharacterized protein (TIGR03435 family)